MKIGNAKIKVPMEVESSEVLESVMYWANKNKTNSSELSKMIMTYFTEQKNMKVLKVQRSEDMSQIIAEVETDLSNITNGSINGSTKLMGKPPKVPTVKRASNEGFTRKNKGFYSYVRECIDELKSKGRNSVEFDELYEMLLASGDGRGNSAFIKDGKAIEKWRVKQYLTKSQMEKNSVIMKGIKRNKDNTGLVF
jgi:hypothetical protein